VETLTLHADSSESLPRALAVLSAGELVAFPTDTVYGLGASAFNSRAVESIYFAKRRPPERAIPVLLADTADLKLVVSELPSMAAILAARFWPGPLTLIVPKNPKLPDAISRTEKVAVRIPDHQVARWLLRAAGPLAVTSANISNGPDACSAAEVLAQLDGRIPLIVDGGQTPGGVPSTLVDCMGPEPVVLRAGAITLPALKSALM